MECINIMTSCDDGIAEYILPQIASIGVNLSNYSVSFFLFHSRVSSEKINLIREYSKTFDNVSFHEIIIEDTEPYEELTKLSGDWPYEAYFSLCCHKHLPKDVERILYIDAADIIIEGDIAEYYFADFEGYSIIATAMQYYHTPDGIRAFNKNDMNDPEILDRIKSGIFNSGVYVINLKKFREGNLLIDHFINIANDLHELFRLKLLKRSAYVGDQGLLSVAFIGDVKFFAYPEIKDAYYMPYNFCIYFFETRDDLWYTPKVLHYAGPGLLKPWVARFSAEEVEKYKFETDLVGDRAPFYLKGRQIEFFEVWWRYCKMTPIYEESNGKASIYARALEAYFLPLCKKYNDLLDSYPQRKEG